MTEADLDAIRQRVEKATFGPWGSHDEDEVVAGDWDVHIATCWNSGIPPDEATNNANFIANARTDIPQLLAAIDERDKVIHDMMEESDARRLAQRYRDVIKAVKYLIRGWRGESSIAERIVFKLIDEALEGNP